MNTISASIKSRRERIADAMRIRWEKALGDFYEDTYSDGLFAQLVNENLRERYFASGEIVIYFGGSKHTLTLTQLEDLCELVRRSYHEQQEAKAAR